MSDLARTEHEQWLQICATLRTLGVVLPADLRAPAMSDATPGQRLLSDLRHWGNLRARMGRETQ